MDMIVALGEHGTICHRGDHTLERFSRVGVCGLVVWPEAISTWFSDCFYENDYEWLGGREVTDERWILKI